MKKPTADITKPTQERSRETQRRLVHATRKLLSKNVFEDLTVAQIASEAGCSVGTFYGRFRNKEAILPHLLEIHYADVENDLEAIISDRKWRQASLENRVFAIVDFLTDTARREPGLIRTLVLRNLSHPETVPESIRTAAGRILRLTYAFIMKSQTEIKHPDPDTALSVGLLMITAAVRERFVMIKAPQADTLTLSEESFIAELKRSLLLNLTAVGV